MQKLYKGLLVLVPLLSLVLVILLVLTGNSFEQKSAPPVYTLKAYKNSVALYADDELTDTYDEIVLNTLPESDQARLKKGIVVNSSAELTKILQDYDG